MEREDFLSNVGEDVEVTHDRCPECDSDDTHHCHHDGDFRAPECDYWLCGECGYQWGHE